MKARLAAVGVAFIMTWPAFAADVFYEQRLEAGKNALRAQRTVEAAEQLRIAAFGLLDEPRRLSEALALLAVAQSALDRTDDLEITLARFVDLETRFRTYDTTAIDAPIRAQFEAILLRAIPRTTLASIPSLARVLPDAAPRPAQNRPAPVPQPVNPPPAVATTTQPATTATSAPQISSGTAPAVQKSPAATVLPPPTSTQPPSTTTAAPANTTTNTAARPAVTTPVPATQPPPSQKMPAETKQAETKPPATAPRTTQTSPSQPATTTSSNPPANQPRATTPATTGSAQALQEAQRLITARRATDAIAVLNRALARDAASRPLRLALLEAATLSSNWTIAALEVPKLQPFTQSEPAYMFYAAVALHETGKTAEARVLLNRALPRLTRTAYVNYHVDRILGTRSANSR